MNTITALESGTYSYTEGYRSGLIQTLTIGHKYITVMQLKASSAMTYCLSISNSDNGMAQIDLIEGIWQALTLMSDIQRFDYGKVIFGMPRSVSAGDTIQIKNINAFDLTRMFGAGNEPSTVAEFEAWLRENDIDPDEYIPYDAGTTKRMTKPSWL